MGNPDCPEVTSNLPPVVNITGNVHQAKLMTTPRTSLQYTGEIEDFHCMDNEDIRAGTISIVNSSDVIIGSVTQFHGPVTIVQHLQAKQAIEDKNDDGTNMVTTDYAAISSKDKLPPSTCLPKRLLVCFTALAVIIVIVILSIIFTVELPITEFEEPDEFENVTGTAKKNLSGHHLYPIGAWGGRPPLYEVNITQPVVYVIISHTAGPQCATFTECSVQMRNIQSEHVSNGSPNVGYNFIIGGRDGDIYEGRGWHTRNFHRDSTIGICFMGNYVYDKLTTAMIDAFNKLLENGLDIGALPTDYQIVAHNQTFATLSPGQNIYKIIKKYPNFHSDMLPPVRT